jgi:hypothetical protein
MYNGTVYRMFKHCHLVALAAVGLLTTANAPQPDKTAQCGARGRMVGASYTTAAS